MPHDCLAMLLLGTLVIRNVGRKRDHSANANTAAPDPYINQKKVGGLK